MTDDEHVPAWPALLDGLAADYAAGLLDADRRRRAERMARATVELPPAPTARRHVERVNAARGIRLTAGASLATSYAERRRVIEHRNNQKAG